MRDETLTTPGDHGAGHPAPPDARPGISRSGGPGLAGADAGAEARLDPAVRALLEQARAAGRQAAESARSHQAEQDRVRRAHAAWARVAGFRGEAIPPGLTGPPLWGRYAELILDLGRLLHEDGWRPRIEAVTPGPPAKGYALALLRKAMDGDREAVEAMLHGAVDTLWHLGMAADGWLREGLMYEVLGIQPPPEPPPGWEGSYYEAVETVQDFVRWIDQELLIPALVEPWRGSGGRLVRNAFRLVDQLGLTDMPLEPLGPLSPTDELAMVRNLRRLCLARLGPASAPAGPDGGAAAGAGRAGQPGEVTREAVVAQFLAGRPGASLDEAVSATGLGPGQVRRTGAWKEHEEAQLARYLGANPTAGAADAQRALGFSRPKVVGMRAWAEHQARRQAARPPRRPRERPLTEAALACRPDASSADPADGAGGRDQVFRAIVEVADADTRARLHALPAARHGELVEHVLGQTDGAEVLGDAAATRQILVTLAQAWLEDQEQQERRERRAERGRRRP